MSAARKSAHGTIPGEIVPPVAVKETVNEPAPAAEVEKFVKTFPAHIAPPSIYADLCRERGFDPSAEADERRRSEEFDRRMSLPAEQW